jgi:hypothetical protein
MNKSIKFALCGIALLALSLPVFAQATSPALTAEIVGEYRGVHEHWQDSVEITAEGRFFRKGGDGGNWTFDGTNLVLAWDNWDPVTLKKEAAGVFFDGVQKFRISKTGEVKTKWISSKHFRLLKNSFKMGEAFAVEFHSMPTGNDEWITLVKKSDAPNSMGDVRYVEERGGVFSIDPTAIEEPGEYEMRAYYGQAGDYTVRDRISFTVSS